MAQIVQKINCGSNNAAGRQSSVVQVLTGDFNAEPQEESVQYLMRERPFVDAAASRCLEYDLEDGVQVEQRLPFFEESDAKVSDGASAVVESAFVDSWMEARLNTLRKSWKERIHRNFADVQPDLEYEEQLRQQAEVDGFTFPACNPVKRIDFILVRNHSLSSGSHGGLTAAIVDSRVIGRNPTPETGTYRYCTRTYFLPETLT